MRNLRVDLSSYGRILVFTEIFRSLAATNVSQDTMYCWDYKRRNCSTGIHFDISDVLICGTGSHQHEGRCA